MLSIKTVTVIGVTGTMGANIAGIFASFGNAKVYCVGRDLDRVKQTLPRIVRSVRADAIGVNLIPADMSMLEACVGESDLVFESAREDMAVKKEIALRVGKALPAHAVSGTGSSGLSITELAGCYPEEARRRFYGIHLFNPPYALPLCELTPTEYADPELTGALKRYLREQLFRTVVEVKDSPAFLANRIGFQFINQAMQYAERYRDSGGIDYMDAILGPFTGRAMEPLATSDFVGLDVHRAIVDNLRENTDDYARDTFVLPAFVRELIAGGKLGRKTRGGLYRQVQYENGFRRMTVYDLSTGIYRDVIPYAFPFAERMKRCLEEGDYQLAFEALVHNHSQEAEICLSFLLQYMLYAFRTSLEVGTSIRAADDVMAAGFNWCPPLAMYEALSAVTDVPGLIRERLPEIWERADAERILREIRPSGYDYRRYFKSGRQEA
ncbi:MAG: 3-hydroxyacyl-CoA dehydrogenase family protein [Clostridia bacterium]|nr:3-hydroxyacyl-CoA dehydrogenase family protein [Clostridia bacterium]